MRIDVVSIFPDYLAPLELSLIGKARQDDLIELTVHDLRDFTHDRHRTVDDTPYGGGAGMVMRPEPWGEALDHVIETGQGASSRHTGAVPHLIVPAPSGRPFTQAMARELAAEPWLAFACGRYEGIDERVLEDAATRMPVTPVSLGDYVLNGGEVAVLAIVEAVARLLPGVIGNAESLVEESHEDGLLEYPVYTKPPVWRGLEVPAVLRGGDHGAIAAWRMAQRRARTAARRPDLLHPSAAGDALADFAMRPATRGDVPELHVLTKACWVAEIQALGYADFGPVVESVADSYADLETWSTWVLRSPDGRLVGSVRGRMEGDHWHIGRLMVAPDLQGRGLGRDLLRFAEEQAPESARGYELVAGGRSTRNLKMYRKAGYRNEGPWEHDPRAVLLRRRRVAK